MMLLENDEKQKGRLPKPAPLEIYSSCQFGLNLLAHGSRLPTRSAGTFSAPPSSIEPSHPFKRKLVGARVAAAVVTSAYLNIVGAGTVVILKRRHRHIPVVV